MTLPETHPWKKNARVVQAASKLVPLLDREGVELQDVVDWYLSSGKAAPSVPCRPMADLLDEYAASKEPHVRPTTVREIRCKCRRFVDSCGTKDPREITAASIEAWLMSRRYRGRTWNQYVTVLNGFFKWMTSRGHVPHNVVRDVTRARVDEKEVVVLTPSEAERLMAAARGTVVQSYVALLLYAGLRPFETWDPYSSHRINPDRDISGDWLKVRPEVAKQRRQRMVRVWPKLRENLDGPAHWERYAFDKVRRDAGVPWDTDICRHTYGSMLLPMLDGDVEKVARQMGNSPDICRRHYLGLVTKEEACAYWGVSSAPVW